MNSQNLKQYCELVSVLLNERNDERSVILKESYENLLNQFINSISESVLESQLLNIGITDYIIIDRKNLYIDNPTIIDTLSRGLNVNVYHRFSADLIGDHMNEGAM